jgi:hypothetical protein
MLLSKTLLLETDGRLDFTRGSYFRSGNLNLGSREQDRDMATVISREQERIEGFVLWLPGGKHILVV